MGSITTELQNKVTHYDVANRVTNSKIWLFLFSKRMFSKIDGFDTLDITI